MDSQRFSDFVYNVENIVDEFVIVALSLGAITVSVYSLFFYPESVDFIQFGDIIAPWIVMLGLMIIGRELWIMNKKLNSYIQQQGEE
ncbi:MAG: hypothetical protein V5A72_00365 [Candidatus Nanohaloarchaea archaeon]